MVASTRDTINGSAAQSERPSCAAPLVENIPEELRAIPQWVVWRYEWRLNKDGSGGRTKVLHNPANGRNADSTKPSTWGSFDKAISKYRREPDKWAGVGFVFANGYGGIDLDACRDSVTGHIEVWALEIVRQIDSYTEISPSGTGLHIFTKVKLPQYRDRKTGKLKSQGINKRNWRGCRKIEIYDSGRFFTVTGNRLDSTPERIEDRQAEVIALYNLVREETGDKPRKERAPKVERAASTQQSATIDDKELIRRMHASPKFEDLFTGGAHSYASDSEADFAFVSILCRVTDDDEQIARIWRLSGLDRDKLRRQDYIDRTISAARNRQIETEQQRPAPLTHREQIICKLTAALNLSDGVFRTLLAIIALANGRRVFKMSGAALAAWIRTPDGWSAAEWKHALENDFDSERVNKQRAIESAFGSDRIRQLIEAFRPIYPILRVKEQGGGFDQKTGNWRGASKYTLDLQMIEEAEALAEQKLTERLEANLLRFVDNPDLARQVAEHEARQLAAVEFAARYIQKSVEETQPEGKTTEVDFLTKLFGREMKIVTRLRAEQDKLLATWVEICEEADWDHRLTMIDLSNMMDKKRQIEREFEDKIKAVFSPEYQRKLKRRKKCLFSSEKQGLNSNTQYGLDAHTDSLNTISQNAPPELSENPTSYQCEDTQDFKSDDWLTELADEVKR